MEEQYLNLIEEALREDIGEGDITTEVIVPPHLIAQGRLVAKEEGVISGLFLAEEVFRKLDKKMEFESLVAEGERVREDEEIARLRGLARALLQGERTALNFLSRLSGISTLTARFVQAVAGTKAKILDTRKTTPGWRRLEKYAVKMGGGVNHRFGLWDMVLVKDNHIDLLGGILQSVGKGLGSPLWKGKKVEVEVRNLRELREVLPLGVKRIMLDNFSPSQIREAMETITKRQGRERPEVEVSGGVNLQNVGEIAHTGVDYISIGSLTHSAPALDISLVIEKG